MIKIVSTQIKNVQVPTKRTGFMQQELQMKLLNASDSYWFAHQPFAVASTLQLYSSMMATLSDVKQLPSKTSWNQQKKKVAITIKTIIKLCIGIMKIKPCCEGSILKGFYYSLCYFTAIQRQIQRYVAMYNPSKIPLTISNLKSRPRFSNSFAIVTRLARRSLDHISESIYICSSVDVKFS